MKDEFFDRPTPVREQAAAWFFAFESGEVDEAGRRQFVNWLKSAPAHIQEFLMISTLHLEVSQSPRLADTIGDLVSEARANVVMLDEAGAETWLTTSKKSTPRRALWVIAATVVLSLGAALAFVLAPGSQGQVFRTARGEQRSIALDDGSVIVINTLSEIRVDYTSSSRRAVLASGEALFDVEEDADRPFTVEAGRMAIRVTGTRFNVYRQEVRTVLTVVEGKVEAAPLESAEVFSSSSAPGDSAQHDPMAGVYIEPASAAVIVTAGEQVAMATNGDMVSEAEAHVERATAWIQRRLIFDNETLERVAEEFNRYNHRRLIIEDPGLASRRITAVINAHDVDALVAFLQRQPGIQVRRDSECVRVSGAPGDGS